MNNTYCIQQFNVHEILMSLLNESTYRNDFLSFTVFKLMLFPATYFVQNIHTANAKLILSKSFSLKNF